MAQEQNGIVDEELKQCCVKGTKQCGSLRRKNGFCRRKAWQLSQSSNKKSHNLEADWEGLMDKVKENGWDRQGRDDKSVCSKQISVKWCLQKNEGWLRSVEVWLEF